MFLLALHLGFTCLLDSFVWLTLFQAFVACFNAGLSEKGQSSRFGVCFFYSNWKNPAENKTLCGECPLFDFVSAVCEATFYLAG